MREKCSQVVGKEVKLIYVLFPHFISFPKNGENKYPFYGLSLLVKKVNTEKQKSNNCYVYQRQETLYETCFCKRRGRKAGRIEISS